MSRQNGSVCVLGAGLTGCMSSLKLAELGFEVTLIDKNSCPISGASMHNEGKLHLGYIYAAQSNERTHRAMAAGSGSFFKLIQELTGISQAQFRFSKPFIYIVPNDSLMSVQEILTHFSIVDDHLDSRGELQKPSKLIAGGLAEIYCPDNVQAAIQTDEIAVDSHQVAAVVGAAVLAHPLIKFVPNHNVISSFRQGDEFCIVVEAAGIQSEHAFIGVVNALWEGRVQIDATFGLLEPAQWMWRWKATISIARAIDPEIPATTALLGPYGDIVEFGRHRTYLSWYPACNQGLTNERGADPLHLTVAEFDRDQVLAESIDGISRLIPAVASIPDIKQRSRISGGYIMAVGTTDISDIKSGLHDRDHIGVHDHGGWISVDTGKYCTAPLFGVEAATRLAQHLADH